MTTCRNPHGAGPGAPGGTLPTEGAAALALAAGHPRGCRAPRRARGAVLVAALALILAAGGCSTGHPREKGVGLKTLLHYRDPATAQYFRNSYRSANLYVDFRPELVADAIVQDRTYRRLYVEMLARQLLLPKAEQARLQAEQDQAFATGISILLFTYEGKRDPSDLTRSNAPWRIFLRDDDGQLQTPAAITRIKENSPTYQYIDGYFRGLDRWSRVYRLDFPKLSKGRLGQTVGPHPVELIVTGVRGTVTLRWAQPGLFYAVPAAPAQAPAAPVAKP